MATTTPPAPYQPANDDDARLAVFQILGSDISTPDTWTGDWHETLRTASALWSGEPVWTCTICHTPNSHWTDTCGHCGLFHAPPAQTTPTPAPDTIHGESIAWLADPNTF